MIYAALRDIGQQIYAPIEAKERTFSRDQFGNLSRENNVSWLRYSH